jgi:phosphoribosylformimino-5-aminoimidazole carboxamide ribotide isomerase
MTIIPAIDLLNGAVVRLRQGSYASASTYAISAGEAARRVADAGLRHLHLVDLDGARAGTSSVASIVSDIMGSTDLHIDVGGGIRSVVAARTVIDAGARSVCLGTIAIEEPNVVDDIAAAVGIEAIIIALDARDGVVRTHGWESDGGLRLGEAVSMYVARGYRRIIVTDIARDGMMSGPALKTYRDLHSAEPRLELVASGGIRSIDDCIALATNGCAGAIIGKAWLDGLIDLAALRSQQW